MAIEDEGGTISTDPRFFPDSVWSGTSDFQNDPVLPEYSGRRFNSYSGADISAIVHFDDPEAKDAEKRHRIKKLADLQTLTFSVYREKMPVRALGHVGAKGYTRGPRTIGGTMIFTVFDKAVLAEMMVDQYYLEAAAIDNIGAFNAVLIDQIPPFDVTVLFANELGSMSKLVIYGVELMQEGQSMSIEDLTTESVVNYVARHFEPMISLYDPGEDFERIGKMFIPDTNFTSLSKNKALARRLADLR